MSELETPAEAVACAECGRELAATEPREETDAGVFCRECFHALRAEVEEVVSRQGEGLNYPSATIAASSDSGKMAWSSRSLWYLR